MRKLSRQVAYLMMSLCIVTGLLSDLAHAQSAKDSWGRGLLPPTSPSRVASNPSPMVPLRKGC